MRKDSGLTNAAPRNGLQTVKVKPSLLSHDGDSENAGVEKAGAENAGEEGSKYMESMSPI